MTTHEETEVAFSEPMLTLKNVAPHPLKFVLLDDHGAARVPPVILDPQRLDKDGQPLPKLFGVGSHQHVRQVRERRVELSPGKAIKLPARFFQNILKVRCDICAHSRANLMGRASLECLTDPKHRPHVTIFAGGIISDPTMIEIDILKGIPLDGAFAHELEQIARETREKAWERPRKAR